MNAELLYALQPITFRSMAEAQEITNQLEDNLANQNLGGSNIRPEVVEIFSELVNNAAEHSISNEGEEEGASAPVRFMSHGRGRAFDIAVSDSCPTIRTALERTPGLHVESDVHALRLAVKWPGSFTRSSPPSTPTRTPAPTTTPATSDTALGPNRPKG